jgi:LPXTG-site transpeptidase (sortase) family protein
VFNHKNILLYEHILLEEEIDEINEDPITEEPTTKSVEPTTTVTTAISGTTTKVGTTEKTTEKTTKTTIKTTKKDSRDNYIGYLEVPDVKIKRGFVSIDSKYNSIGYNVTIIKGSTMPDVDKGNFILAAHRGSSKVSYFENLYKLKVGSKAYVTYGGKKYTYKLVEIYEVPKTGTITIARDGSKTTLTLITCTRNNKKTQTVFNYELISVN